MIDQGSYNHSMLIAAFRQLHALGFTVILHPDETMDLSKNGYLKTGMVLYMDTREDTGMYLLQYTVPALLVDYGKYELTLNKELVSGN